MQSESGRTNMKVIFTLSFLHFVGDFYNSFVIPLLPVFEQRFSLTLAQIGLITAMTRLLSFVVQPPVGYLADHYQTRVFVLGGPLLSVVFVSLVGAAPNFSVLLLFVALGSIGSSMFHPTAAGMVHGFAGLRFSYSMAVYNIGGTFAFGAGPLFIAWVVDRYGLTSSPITMVLGLVLMALVARRVPLPTDQGMGRIGFVASMKEVFGGVWKWIVLIWLVSVLRTFVGQSFLTFIPVLYSREGHSLFSIGLVVALYNMAGALSGLVSGILSDRFGYKPVFYLSYLLAIPFLYLLLYPALGVYVASFLAGFFVMATVPLFVTMAQEIAPRGKSLVASLMLGLAYGTGGMMTPVTGRLADLFSIRTVLCALAFFPILLLGLVYFLPEKNRSPG